MESFLDFIKVIENRWEENQFVRLLIMNKSKKSEELKSIAVKRITTKKGELFSFNYRYPTKDITKNYSFEEGISLIKNLLTESFFQAEFYSLNEDVHFSSNKRGEVKFKTKEATTKVKPSTSHDRKKNHIIESENSPFLKALGVVSPNGKVKKDKQDKFRQINKYIEVVDNIIRNSELEYPLKVVDMGAGKGYLTFALYHYLKNIKEHDVSVLGVELRKELVEKCNGIAKDISFEHSSFQQGTIQDAILDEIDVLIALHACDTATDDAIFKGIQSKAQIIICAPCCHKQVRKSLCPTDALQEIAQYGILKERQAEILTDGIRALLLEANGYKTKVFEFIATEHTPKNVLIVGVKSEFSEERKKDVLKQISEIKSSHGLEKHYLEELLITKK